LGTKPTILGKKIVLLRRQGLSYRAIAKTIPCSKSTVCYHLKGGQKAAKQAQHRAYMLTGEGAVSKKINSFKSRIYKLIQKREFFKRKKTARQQVRHKMKLYRRRSRSSSYDRVNNINKPYGIKEVLGKLGSNPRCYLTGSQIDLAKSETYSLDHVTPISKGGTNDLENMGLATRNANMAKNDLTVSQFVALCKQVLINRGYHVKKIGKEQKKKRRI